MEGMPLSLDCEIEMSFCFIKPLFIGETEGDVKEDSVNCKSLYRGSITELGFCYFTGEFER